jgi:hypothetical protein
MEQRRRDAEQLLVLMRDPKTSEPDVEVALARFGPIRRRLVLDDVAELLATELLGTET